MKKSLLLLLMFLVPLFGMSQTPKAPASPQAKKPVSPFVDYAGDWTSNFDGKVWLRLELVMQGEKLSGEMVHARNITTDDSGALTSVSEEQSSEIVTDANLNPDGLVLTIKDAASQEIERYLMRVILPAKQTADLKMIGQTMPAGMAKPKPWRLVKADAAGSSSRQ